MSFRNRFSGEESAVSNHVQEDKKTGKAGSSRLSALEWHCF